MVKLRNSWGKMNWNGPWSKGSSEWSEHPTVGAALLVRDRRLCTSSWTLFFFTHNCFVESVRGWRKTRARWLLFLGGGSRFFFHVQHNLHSDRSKWVQRCLCSDMWFFFSLLYYIHARRGLSIYRRLCHKEARCWLPADWGWLSK